MSRCAMRLPMVARRSPAITTPPSKVAATIVVACGTCGTVPGGSCWRPGSRWSAWTARNSVNDEEPGIKCGAGARPSRKGSSVTVETLSRQVCAAHQDQHYWSASSEPFVPDHLEELD